MGLNSMSNSLSSQVNKETATAVRIQKQVSSPKTAPVFKEPKAELAGNIKGTTPSVASRETNMAQGLGNKREAEKKMSVREEEDREYDQVMAEKAVENANNRVRAIRKSMKFSYNEDIQRFTISITDEDSNKVIKEIPPKGIQQVIERLHTMQGLLTDMEV
ncbi:MAG: flagellar protein FlaG [Lachnospiraceae bacterium]|jgi:flagellar protein FlaG|nr:flagellar protein FlaG [Lachnospiraceae bacterium]